MLYFLDELFFLSQPRAASSHSIAADQHPAMRSSAGVVWRRQLPARRLRLGWFQM